MKLGLKCNTSEKQFLDRIDKQPDIIEFHLTEEDLFGKNRDTLEERIEYSKATGKSVYLHHPMKFRGVFLDITDQDVINESFYLLSTLILIEISKKYNIKTVIHPHYHKELTDNKLEEENQIMKQIYFYESISDGTLLWENSSKGVFTTENEEFFIRVAEDLNINLCFDISHAFISYQGDNQKLKRIMERLEKQSKYYHVCDSLGLVHDSLIIGEGRIDWESILSIFYKKPMILEVNLSNQVKCKEMMESYEKIKQFEQNLID